MLGSKKTLTLQAAKRLAAAAAQEATNNSWAMVIAIVDDGGHLLYLERMDGGLLGSVEVAIGKARSAIQFKRPHQNLRRRIGCRAHGNLETAGAIPIEGGVPFAADGRFLGAIGVSGAAPQQDGLVAQAGAEEFARILLELR